MQKTARLTSRTLFCTDFFEDLSNSTTERECLWKSFLFLVFQRKAGIERLHTKGHHAVRSSVIDVCATFTNFLCWSFRLKLCAIGGAQLLTLLIGFLHCLRTCILAQLMWAERQPKTSLKWPNSQKLEQKFAFSRAMLLAWNLTFASLMWTCQNSIKPTPKLSNGTGVKVSRKDILFSCTVFWLVVRSSQRSRATCPGCSWPGSRLDRGTSRHFRTTPEEKLTNNKSNGHVHVPPLSKKKSPDGAAAGHYNFHCFFKVDSANLWASGRT